MLVTDHAGCPVGVDQQEPGVVYMPWSEVENYLGGV